MPPASEPVRVVSAIHDACGARTRVRLPSAVPARAVRRFRCAGCRQSYETEEIEDGGVVAPPEHGAAAARNGAHRQAAGRLRMPAGPRLRRPALAFPSLPSVSLPRLPSAPRLGLPSFDPHSRGWQLASAAIGALAVVAILIVIQGSGDESNPLQDQNDSRIDAVAPVPEGGGDAQPSDEAQLVRGSSFSVALPAGWERIRPEGGATFAAVSADGDADATLWIERDPKLDFTTFESRSLDQLRSLAGSAHVVDRTAAPTPEATVVRLAADAPEGQPQVEATLRVAGPYRYYLVTTVQADASRTAVDGAEVIHGSFTPQAGAKG